MLAGSYGAVQRVVLDWTGLFEMLNVVRCICLYYRWSRIAEGKGIDDMLLNLFLETLDIFCFAVSFNSS